ncbi:MAG: HNH endonuclease [Caldilineaceae bacterium]|jgi:hypothetical protein
MSDYIPLQLRRWLETLGERCEYCQTSEFVTGVALEADHIWPRSLQGPTSRENLCRACSSCNTQKNDRVEALDPLTEERVALFNPRQQRWSEHFRWSRDGAEIIGLTPYGRATVVALKMNNPRLVRSRRMWVSVGWHPPKE